MTEITTADELQEADSLRQRGVISQEEFDTFKARLLGTSVTASVSEPEEVPPRVAEPLFPAPPDTSSGAPPEPPLSPPPSPPVEVAPAPVRSRFAKAPRSRLMIGGIGVVVLALVVTLVMFVTVIGHGGGKLTLTGAPRQIVLGAFSRTAAAKSLHMQYTYAVSGTPSFAGHKGKPVSVSMTAQGAVDLTNKSGALTFTGPGPNGKGTQVTAMRIIGPTLYLSTSGLSRVDGGKPWIHVGLAQYEQATGETGFSSFLTGNLSQSLGVLRQEVQDHGPRACHGRRRGHGPLPRDAARHRHVVLGSARADRGLLACGRVGERATSAEPASAPDSALRGQHVRHRNSERLQLPGLGIASSSRPDGQRDEVASERQARPDPRQLLGALPEHNSPFGNDLSVKRADRSLVHDGLRFRQWNSVRQGGSYRSGI